MATRSTISMQRSDGSVAQIYCHWDGYPSHNGRILLKHYNRAELVEQLIALGDLSSLGDRIGSQHDFDHAPEGECNAYGRDRGESDCEARVYGSYRQIQRVSYNYLWSDGQWWLIDRENHLVPLVAVMQEVGAAK